MSAEFYVKFKESSAYVRNRFHIEKKIKNLSTFKHVIGREEYWLKNDPLRTLAEDEWKFDVRIFLRSNDILLEINLHPEDIEKDVSALVKFLQTIDKVSVVDDDGEPVNLTF